MAIRLMKPSTALFVRLTAPIQRVAASLLVSKRYTLEGFDWLVELVATTTSRPSVSAVSSTPVRSTGRHVTTACALGISRGLTGSETLKARSTPLKKLF